MKAPPDSRLQSRSVYLVSLGCPKNRVDSEMMLGRLLEEGGWAVSGDPSQADLIMVNSCAFIAEAVEESLDTVLELSRWKRDGRCRWLVVTGCLPQRYGPDLLDLLPEVDLFLGPAEVPHIGERLREIVAGASRACWTGPPAFLGEEAGPRVISSGGPTAYVKIAEGCSNRCTYCTIPTIRGPFRSRTISSVAEEVETLVRRGIVEIVLVAQDTTAFGLDRCGKGELPSLLRVLDEIDGLRWIRLMYVHPGRVDEDLLKAFADSERMVPYLDMPIQHIDAQVLRRMNRKMSPSCLRRAIQEIRQCRPGMHLRTSLMVGFPGETQRAFERLVHFVEEARFEWMGVFPFSPEEGTPAASMVPRVPKGVIRERCRRLMEVQRRITSESLARWVGKEVEVLIEGWDDTRERWVGRTAFQAPEVDGVVLLEGERRGQFKGMVRAMITDRLDYDLVGRILDEDSTVRNPRMAGAGALRPSI